MGACHTIPLIKNKSTGKNYKQEKKKKTDIYIKSSSCVFFLQSFKLSSILDFTSSASVRSLFPDSLLTLWVFLLSVHYCNDCCDHVFFSFTDSNCNYCHSLLLLPPSRNSSKYQEVNDHQNYPLMTDFLLEIFKLFKSMVIFRTDLICSSAM